MKTAIRIAALALSMTVATAANAGVSVSATAGSNPYAGPMPTYNFDSATPTFSGGAVITTGTSSGLYAQPYGSTGNYFSVGPSTSSPATILFNGLGDIFTLSLLWGSIDTYNTLALTDAAGNSLGAGYTFTGSQIAALVPSAADGCQGCTLTNPIVTFMLTGADAQLVRGIQLTSTSNAFEIDNIAINSGVPEPATWALMILGLGGIGASLRRRRRQGGSPAFSFA